MQYSDLLMTSIFISRGLTAPARPRPSRLAGGRRKEAVMPNELQRSGPGVGLIDGTNRPNSCVSTLSLCNANFGRG
jgi:hypothetical protein